MNLTDNNDRHELPAGLRRELAVRWQSKARFWQRLVILSAVPAVLAMLAVTAWWRDAVPAAAAVIMAAQLAAIVRAEICRNRARAMWGGAL